MKTKTSLTTDSIGPSSRHCPTVPGLLIALVLACFALSPIARAVDPPPDGGYPGGNTAEGQDALLKLSRGKYNTAVGFKTLSDITIGDYNTAVGGAALRNGDEGVNNTAIGYAAMFSNKSGSNNTAISGSPCKTAVRSVESPQRV